MIKDVEGLVIPDNEAKLDFFIAKGELSKDDMIACSDSHILKAHALVLFCVALAVFAAWPPFFVPALIFSLTCFGRDGAIKGLTPGVSLTKGWLGLESLWIKAYYLEAIQAGIETENAFCSKASRIKRIGLVVLLVEVFLYLVIKA